MMPVYTEVTLPPLICPSCLPHICEKIKLGDNCNFGGSTDILDWTRRVVDQSPKWLHNFVSSMILLIAFVVKISHLVGVNKICFMIKDVF